jgi:hypothetical protein
MDKITTKRETTHAIAQVIKVGPEGRALTLCGQTVGGRTGGTLASGITCGTCKRVMRRHGWQV